MSIHIVPPVIPFFGWVTVDMEQPIGPVSSTNQFADETITDPEGVTYTIRKSVGNRSADPNNLTINADGTILMKHADVFVTVTTTTNPWPYHHAVMRVTLTFYDGFALFVSGPNITVLSSPAGASDPDPAGNSIKGDGQWVLETAASVGFSANGDDAGAAEAGSSMLIEKLELDTRITTTF